MPAPSASTFQRPDLGESFSEYDLSADEGFIGREVLPTMNVSLQTANFSKTRLEDLIQEIETARGSGSGYARDDFQFTQDNYATQEHGFEAPVDDRERSIYSYTLELEKIAAMRAVGVVRRRQERKIAAAVFNTGTWTGSSLTTAVGTRWSDCAASDPIGDIRAAAIKVRNAIGRRPTVGICDWEVAEYLKDNASILNRLKFAGLDEVNKGKITYEMLASILGLDRLIVAGAMKNTANKGQTASLGAIWGSSYFMVARLATSRDLREPCIGRLFVYTGDGADEDGTVEEYREEKIRSQVMRVRTDYVSKILYPQAGHLLTNITA